MEQNGNLEKIGILYFNLSMVDLSDADNQNTIVIVCRSSSNEVPHIDNFTQQIASVESST